MPNTPNHIVVVPARDCGGQQAGPPSLTLAPLLFFANTTVFNLYPTKATSAWAPGRAVSRPALGHGLLKSRGNPLLAASRRDPSAHSGP